MLLDKINVKIYPLFEKLLKGGGFYQVEESTLQITTSHTNSKNQFFSSLECDNFRIDTDQNGKILFIELYSPKKSWLVTENIKFPHNANKADIRILDFRKSIAIPKLLTNHNNTILKIEWFKEHSVAHYFIATDIVLEVNNNSQLTSIWINNITNDIAGKSLAKSK